MKHDFYNFDIVDHCNFMKIMTCSDRQYKRSWFYFWGQDEKILCYKITYLHNILLNYILQLQKCKVNVHKCKEFRTKLNYITFVHYNNITLEKIILQLFTTDFSHF